MKIMKTKTLLLCLLAIIAIGAGQPTKHQVVILKGTPAFTRLNPTQYQWQGITVFCSSSSQGAPTFEPATFNQDGSMTPATGLADAIATLLDQGFKVEWQGEQIIATKP